jgi:hypothetical protein|nr:MAG TPA: hypothetical protein [Bacteriophage sp.]
MTLKPEHIVEALNKKTFDEIDPDEVLKHYGYKPEEVRCNGVGIGVWRKEEAFQKLGDIGAFMRFVDHTSFQFLLWFFPAGPGGWDRVAFRCGPSRYPAGIMREVQRRRFDSRETRRTCAVRRSCSRS